MAEQAQTPTFAVGQIWRTTRAIQAPEMRAYWGNRLRYLADELKRLSLEQK